MAMRAAKFKGVSEDPQNFAALPNETRTPAEVFPNDHQAVIDLADEKRRLANQRRCRVERPFRLLDVLAVTYLIKLVLFW